MANGDPEGIIGKETQILKGLAKGFKKMEESDAMKLWPGLWFFAY
jgi:hypothetical protein